MFCKRCGKIVCTSCGDVICKCGEWIADMEEPLKDFPFKNGGDREKKDSDNGEDVQGRGNRTI